jgi:hypothetical protein
MSLDAGDRDLLGSYNVLCAEIGLAIREKVGQNIIFRLCNERSALRALMKTHGFTFEDGA